MRKDSRSLTIRASAGRGSWRASRPVMPGPLLGLGGLDRAAQRLRQADREHALVDQARRADRQRRLHHVVPAEDEVTQRRQARSDQNWW